MASQNKQRKIVNPFVELPGYNCYGCSPDNSFGLHMTFAEEGEVVTSTWNPEKKFQGYFGILHGGIQAALMDEIASWVVYVKLKTAGFTSRAEVRYHKTVYVEKGPLKLYARPLKMRRNLADIEVKLFDSKGIKCASGIFTYFTFSEEQAKDTMYYPAHNDFFEEGEAISGNE
ncbi:MAG: PaaI family thioesterase [Bacteroidales bacterium]|nr:PaaI family thioesterase [Bacteroidales bacterium]